jgi:hypothetical protein
MFYVVSDVTLDSFELERCEGRAHQIVEAAALLIRMKQFDLEDRSGCSSADTKKDSVLLQELFSSLLSEISGIYHRSYIQGGYAEKCLILLTALLTNANLDQSSGRYT